MLFRMLNILGIDYKLRSSSHCQRVRTMSNTHGWVHSRPILEMWVSSLKLVVCRRLLRELLNIAHVPEPISQILNFLYRKTKGLRGQALSDMNPYVYVFPMWFGVSKRSEAQNVIFQSTKVINKAKKEEDKYLLIFSHLLIQLDFGVNTAFSFL